MWEAVTSALIIHLGKTAIDKFWSYRSLPKSPILNQTGNITYASRDASGRTIIPRSLQGPQNQKSESLFGKFYFPSSVQDLLIGDEIALVLVFGENNQQVFLFEADIDNGYMVDLPFGNYSILVFIIDPEEQDIFNAEIYAMGFPTAHHVDLSGIGSIVLQNYADIWNLVDLSPVIIKKGGPFYLDFILFDTDVEIDLPKSFSEIFHNESQVLGYICSHCGQHVTSIKCTCGANISEVTCNSCGNRSQIYDICPNCFVDIESIKCYRCHRIISTLICPGCGRLIPI